MARTRGLKAEDIMLEARIISAADVVEAVASRRPYGPRWASTKRWTNRARVVLPEMTRRR